ESLSGSFADIRIDDRRNRPSYGYRAVHVLVKPLGKVVELQVRPELQHWWAELSERLSDAFDPALKYGGGPEEVRDTLLDVRWYFSSLDSQTWDSSISPSALVNQRGGMVIHLQQ